MSNTLNSANGKLNDISKRFVLGLSVVRGTVEAIGRLEKNRSWHTDYRSGTAGKFFNSGFFLAGTRGSSDRQEIINHSINLLKIGPTTTSNVMVGSSAIYDAMKQGNKVACIFDVNKSQLFYMNNFTTGTSLGFQPNWSRLNMYKWLCAIIGGFCLYFSLSSFSILGIAFGVLCIAGFQIFNLALKRSIEIWGIALQQIQRP